MEWFWGTAWDAQDEAAMIVVGLFLILVVPVIITGIGWKIIGKIMGRPSGDKA